MLNWWYLSLFLDALSIWMRSKANMYKHTDLLLSPPSPTRPYLLLSQSFASVFLSGSWWHNFSYPETFTGNLYMYFFYLGFAYIVLLLDFHCACLGWELYVNCLFRGGEYGCEMKFIF